MIKPAFTSQAFLSLFILIYGEIIAIIDAFFDLTLIFIKLHPIIFVHVYY